jgi:hypothetical protein
MTKKQTTKKLTTRRPSVKERARKIVASRGEYDYDTRKTIEEALRDKRLNGRDLAKMVREAEKGELVEHPIDDCFEQDYRDTAHHTIQFLESGLPDWLLQATCWVINAVAEEHNIEVSPDDGEGNYSAKALGDLFRVSGLYQFDDLPDLDFADTLSRALRHPDCPIELYNAVADCDCIHVSRWDTPGNLREALCQRREAEQEGDAQEGGEGR